MDFEEEVYYSLLGMSINPLDNVENLFEEGKPCEQWYSTKYNKILTTPFCISYNDIKIKKGKKYHVDDDL